MSKENYKGKNNGKGKGGNRKDGRNGKKSYDEMKRGDRFNDGRPQGGHVVVGQSGDNEPEWYTVNSQLVEATTKIPIYPFAGKPIVTTSKGVGTSINYTVPGIMRLKYAPIVGVCDNANDAVNIAAQNIFQTMRKKLSTVANYAPADVMMMILAIDGIFMYIANLTRLYGLVNAWNTDNWYLPNDLIAAGYGWTLAEVTDFRNNLNEFRTRLNMEIYKASSLYAPMDFNIVKRHLWINSNVFCDDGANSRAQFYIPVCQYYPILDETTVETGTALAYEDLFGATWKSSLDHLDQMIEKVRNSDSYTAIMADMRRAFEGVKTIELAYVPENYIVTATNSQYFKEQLHNATLASSIGKVRLTGARYPGDKSEGEDKFNNQFYVYQSVDANVVVSQPYLTYATSKGNDYTPLRIMEGDKLLNLYSKDTDTKVLAEATRSMLICHGVRPGDWGNSSVNAVKAAKVDSAGGDILMSAEIFVHNKNGDPTEYPFIQVLGSRYTANEPEKTVQKQMSLSLPFDFSPMQYYCEGDGQEVLPMTEIDYYMIVPNSTLALMNEAIMTSMWDLPRIVENNMSGGSKI